MPEATALDLNAALKHYFGFSSFRPLQEDIVRDALAGRDVFALLPTGGGKSLCFQLPALLRPGLTVVVSPLIALMKDQVDGLVASGITATFLNSTLKYPETRARMKQLDSGACKILYVAPERLMQPEFLADMHRWKVGMIAIDEAHCISEWGHDFRPVYRELAQLRGHFPDCPFMALTATATQRVREDIVKHLQLRSPRCYVASFNRPNLMYRVIDKNSGYDQVLDFIQAVPNESGIVYCLARKTTEAMAEFLLDNNVAARPYHAGLTPAERTANQESFLRDDVRVICATIAFGMGINKPNVRFVVHYDLPKNIEGYYQETGRAGRDGLPSECLLLFSRGDVARQMHFIDKKENPKEQEIARKQLWQMADYADHSGCRRVPLLQYFGEKFTQPNCEGCDFCGSRREKYDGTVRAQKFLSCVYRVRQRSPEFGMGLSYIADLLVGKESAVSKRWEHGTLSTFGIGKDVDHEEWLHVGRQLAGMGFLQEKISGKHRHLELSPEGKLVLTQRKKIQLARPEPAAAAPVPVSTPPPAAKLSAGTFAAARATGSSSRARRPSRKLKGNKKLMLEINLQRGEIAWDEALFQRLRILRKRIADERNLPAYIIFSDASLKHMASACPTTRETFGMINGVGDAKLEQFAEPFLEVITHHMAKKQR